METTSKVVPVDVLRSRASLLTTQIAAANDSLAPLLCTLPALETDDVFFSVKVLNKFSNACLSTVSVSGMMMTVMLPSFREIVQSKIEAVIDQRSQYEKELFLISQQLQAMGISHRESSE